jgi:hypothetical protein
VASSADMRASSSASLDVSWSSLTRSDNFMG